VQQAAARVADVLHVLQVRLQSQENSMHEKAAKYFCQGAQQQQQQ
jgi:hypothetical protein